MSASRPGLKPSRQIAIESLGGVSKTVPLLTDKLALGRSSANELAYPEDLSLSRNHLVFERIDGEWWVRDLGSRNGTFVNKRRVAEPLRLQSGDEITAGALTMHYSVSAPEPDVTFVEAPLSPPAAQTYVVDLAAALNEGTTLAWKEKKPIQALIRAGQELSSNMPLPDLFRLILDLSIDASSAGRGVLLTLEGDRFLTQAATGGVFEISTTVRNRVVEKRESVLVVDALLDQQFSGAESIVAQRVRSFMAVPLQTGAKVLGLIYLDVVNILRPFTREDLSLLTVMANIAAIRVEQARLAEVEQNERIHAHELAQAAEIQNGLLPAAPPHVDGLDICGRNIPCRTVGGDYFDYFPYPDGRLAVVVGDVSGKGMPAALLMSSLEARLQVLAESAAQPSELMARLNRGLKAKCPGNRFVTFFFGVFDTRTGELVYSNAGHNPPIVVRRSGQLEELKAGGLVLGLLDGMPYEQAAVTLNEGDVLVMFSDGVSECSRADADEEFGEARLAELVLNNRHRSAAALSDHIIDALREWSSGAPFADDVTIVVAKRTALE